MKKFSKQTKIELATATIEGALKLIALDLVNNYFSSDIENLEAALEKSFENHRERLNEIVKDMYKSSARTTGRKDRPMEQLTIQFEAPQKKQPKKKKGKKS